MKQMIKRLFSLLLVLVMVVSLLPAVYAKEQEQQAQVLTEADYAAVNAVIAQIDAAEDRQYKNASQTKRQMRRRRLCGHRITMWKALWSATAMPLHG